MSSSSAMIQPNFLVSLLQSAWRDESRDLSIVVQVLQTKALGGAVENWKFPEVVRRGCRGSSGPMEQRASCIGADCGCTGAKRVSDAATLGSTLLPWSRRPFAPLSSPLLGISYFRPLSQALWFHPNANSSWAVSERVCQSPPRNSHVKPRLHVRLFSVHIESVKEVRPSIHHTSECLELELQFASHNLKQVHFPEIKASYMADTSSLYDTHFQHA